MKKSIPSISPGRYISRNVVLDNRPIGLAIVEVADNGMVTAEPFVNETAFTRWVDSVIEIDSNTNPPTVTFNPTTTNS